MRETLAALISGKGSGSGYLCLFVPAVLLALGLEAGYDILPISGLYPRTSFVLLSTLLWIVSAAGLNWLCLVYVRVFSRRLFSGHTGAMPPRGGIRLLGLGLTVLLGAAYFLLLAWRLYFIYGAQVEDAQIVFTGLLWGGFIALALLIPGLFLASWVLFQLKDLLWSPRCPACGKVTRRRPVLGLTCEHCGADLASWAFTDSPGETNTSREKGVSVTNGQGLDRQGDNQAQPAQTS
jgi:hypothetical protein